MKHPTPWRSIPHGLMQGRWLVVDADDRLVCGDVDEATALEIVRCVNAHEALVGACEMVSAHPDFKCRGCGIAIQEALTLAREAT